MYTGEFNFWICLTNHCLQAAPPSISFRSGEWKEHGEIVYAILKTKEHAKAEHGSLGQGPGARLQSPL